MAVGVVLDNEHINAVALYGDFIKQMSKSFAQVVRMDEGRKEVPLAEQATFVSDVKNPFFFFFVLWSKITHLTIFLTKVCYETLIELTSRQNF